MQITKNDHRNKQAGANNTGHTVVCSLCNAVSWIGMTPVKKLGNCPIRNMDNILVPGKKTHILQNINADLIE